MRLRAGLALIACLVLGAVLGFFLPEFGILGIVVMPASLLLLGLFLVQGDTRTRLRRIGAFLIGGGIGGIVLLLSIIFRTRNICGGHAQLTRLPGGGFSYECYSIDTLWGLIPYAALLGLGGLMLVLAWRRPTESTTL